MKTTGQDLYKKAKTLIPGGVHLLSKRPEMFLPDQWPAYYSRAKGAEIWDLDGRQYIDMSINNVGACVLGYADPDVNEAVKATVDLGSTSSLNCPEEVELAELLCELHPWANMVRYTRSGGESMAVAVRIARAKARRDKVAFCGYHGWSDWYLAANLADGDVLGDGQLLPGLEPLGVPRGLAGTALAFHYNRIDELKQIVAKNRSELAAIVMEPQRSNRPEPGFLEEVRDIATEIGAVLIFDEISSAMRKNTGGIHLVLGVNPDIAVFSKAISNGYAMGAIIGTADVMQAAQNTFISSTCWTERVGPTAALATTRKYMRLDVGPRLTQQGLRIQAGWRAVADATGLHAHIGSPDLPALSHITFDYPNSRAIKTLVCQEMLDRGFLDNGGYYATYAHTDAIIEQYLATVNEVFRVIAEAVEKGEVEHHLRGPVGHSGFARLT